MFFAHSPNEGEGHARLPVLISNTLEAARFAFLTGYLFTFNPASYSLSSSANTKAKEHWNRAISHHKDGNFKAEVEHLRIAATLGDATAQCQLGLYYYRGQGVEKNLEEMMELFYRAAQQDAACAQYNLGIYHYEEKNFSWAVMLWQWAAVKNHPRAQCRLGDCFFEGKGTAQNLQSAAEWYREAAIQAYPEAQYKLGTCYSEGMGVTKDLKKAKIFYKASAVGGYSEAHYALGKLYYVSAGENPALLNKALKLLRHAAQKGVVRAQYYLGKCYEDIHEFWDEDRKNLEMALEFFRQAAKNGEREAQYSLGGFYRAGTVVKQDLEAAAQYYRKAANQGHEEAEKALKELNEQQPLEDFQHMEDEPLHEQRKRKRSH